MAEKIWYVGRVVTLNPEKYFGFIKPEVPLPEGFDQNKDVYFNLRRVQGPEMEKGTIVEFQLNQKSQHTGKQEAFSVKQLGWEPPPCEKPERPRSRYPDRNRPRSVSRPRNDMELSVLSERTDTEGNHKRSRSSSHQRQSRQFSLAPQNISYEENDSEDRKKQKHQGNGNIESVGGAEIEMSNNCDGTRPKTKHRNNSPKNQSRKRELYADVDSTKSEMDDKPKRKRSDFVSKIQGRVCFLKDDFGYIKPLSLLPTGYPEEADVFFRLANIPHGGMEIRVHDLLEFTLGTQKKEKPMAMSIKVIRFVKRTLPEITVYLNTLNSQLISDSNAPNSMESNVVNEKEMIYKVVSCDAVWPCLAESSSLSESMETIALMIKVILLLIQKAKGMQHTVESMVKAVASSKLFDPWNGILKDYINHYKDLRYVDTLKDVKDLMLIVVDKVPEKSPCIVTLLKPLVSTDSSSMENYLYKMLRQSTQHCTSNVDDLPWENLPLVPTAEELTCGPLENSSALQPVREKGPYDSAEQYMDVYFRLLRADCFSALRNGVRDFLDGRLDNRDMNVYHSVKLVGIHLTQQNSGLSVALQLKPLKPVKNWSRCSNLMFGNLLCLSLTGSFRDPIWATVVNRDVKLLETKGIVIVEFCTENNTASDSAVITQLSHGSGRIIAVESPTYYKAFQPVLKTLQKRDPSNIPFFEEIVQSSTTPKYPTFLNTTTTVDSTILHGSTGHRSDSLKGAIERDHTSTSLDQSQFVALWEALMNRVGIIQGPPGTGKTFIGVRLVEMILSMSTVPLKPILVLTYKNHALDEFMKDMVDKFPGEVARIGGRCKEAVLDSCNLNELRKIKKSKDLGRLMAQKYSESDEIRPLVKSAVKELDSASLYSRTTLLCWATEQQIISLLEGTDFEKAGRSGAKKKLTIHDVRKYLVQVDSLNTDLKTFLLSTPTANCEEDLEILQNVQYNLNSIIDVAFRTWYPGNKIVKEVETSLGTYSSLEIDTVNRKEDSDSQILDDLHDEAEIEKQEGERMAAIGHQVARNVEIIELHSGQKHDSDICLFSTAKHVVAKLPLAKLMNCANLWDLNLHDRVKFIQAVLLKQIEDPKAEFDVALTQYQQICAEKNELDLQHSLSVLENKKVVGMTITGASIHQDLLQMLQPAVVLVEEAAEVLEPQLIAALNESVQQLILIGDHKQLRPPVENYALTKRYHFDVSMMERLINNDLPYRTLALQNRMRPEIARLLRDIYPELRDNTARVTKNERPKCIETTMYFWDHQDKEKGGRSYWNEGEAERAVRLCLYFLQQGYTPAQITILAAYQGQTALLRKNMRKAETDYPELFPEETVTGKDQKPEISRQRVEIQTIDLYQGDENDIVIVSLVRSNDQRKAGFLQVLNRRCVAQSRSRCGLYFIGNSETVCSVGHWKILVKNMKEENCFGSRLTLLCPRHPNITAIQVTTAKDITLGNFCKMLCNQIMKCGVHFCSKCCQPTHRHDYCRVMVKFTIPRCGHVTQKECSQREDSVICKSMCDQLMHCRMHVCHRNCHPQHSHDYCSERVTFTYQKCGHSSSKQCSEKEEDLPCKEEVKLLHPLCRHTVSKQCFQPVDKAKCKMACSKKLTCGHTCQNLCGEPCNYESCKDCKRIQIEREKQERELERRRIAKYKSEIQKELDQVRSKPFYRIEIKPIGDTASEYFQIEDRVKRYVQPMHDWLPNVKKIEKVHNPDLLEKWLKAKFNLFDPSNSVQLFHGTDAVDSIVKDGFLLPSKGGMFGRGVYFATDSSKSARDIYTKGSNMLLLCEVLLGKCKTTTKALPGMSHMVLKQISYDSLYAQRGTQDTQGVMNDEYVVYNPDQALVKYIVHYEKVDVQKDITSRLNFLSNAGKFEKHILKPNRTLNIQDPLHMNFRIAESQFLRLVSDRKLNFKLNAVEYYVNPPLIANFKAMAAKMDMKYKGKEEANFVPAFHGTRPDNIDSIVKTNFSLSKLASNTGNKGAFGAGIYFSEFPDVSAGYGSRMLLCLLLPGKSYECKGTMLGAPLQSGYDSHIVQVDAQGRGQELVIYNPDQILPCYVLEITK